MSTAPGQARCAACACTCPLSSALASSSSSPPRQAVPLLGQRGLQLVNKGRKAFLPAAPVPVHPLPRCPLSLFLLAPLPCYAPFQIFSASPFQSFTNAPGGGEASEEAAVIEEPRWALFGNGGAGLQVSTKSHAFLRPAFWDHRPDAWVANVSAWYAPRTAEARQQV